ncbi:phosphoenolpyruvate--protein phosphotransferase [Pendulispora rubella]|uniref:Phosphoenolpyruvate--protein phosphotransferase n=1 Tax=Pendulispora rubella TaxID=2741070 RepID=A0ABZ2L3N4_9BACT
MRVGIVVVSHSARLAEGVCEMAAQMAPDVAIHPAGGTEEGGIGTSFDKILAAATNANGGAGVVILYDLGSAKMSADLVAEMEDGVRVVDAPLVEGTMAAAVTAQGGADIDAVAASAGGPAQAEPARAPVALATARVFTLQNPLGLHARPAARLARIASEHGVALRVGPEGGGLVDARSILAVVALGLRGGATMRIEAEGEKAAAALSAIEVAVRDGFGDAPVARPSSTHAAVPGLAIGPIRRLRAAEPIVPEVSGDPATEAKAFERALAHVGRELGREHTDLAEAHRLLLSDPELLTATQTAIASGLAAAPAWWRSVQHARNGLLQSTDTLVAGRAMDVVDVGLRVLAQLTPDTVKVDATDFQSAIVLADDLTPSMVGQLADAGVAGIVLAQGGATAHSVVVARGRGLPMLVRMGELAGVPDGAMAILDGDRGALVVTPASDLLAEARARQLAAVAAHMVALETAHAPVTARDGRTIVVAANVASLAEAHLARERGADAIGLLRTELFFVDKANLPTEDEQMAQLAGILAAFPEREVTIRTLDVGGDKDIPALGLDAVIHGFLGLRGLRHSLAHPEILRIQLRAILRAAASWKGTLSVMAPMVTTADDVLAFRAAVADAARSLEGQPHRRPDHIGIMVEVPACAVAFDSMAAHVDFVSVGTNDLVQYMMAAERTNASVANWYQPDHPAIWRTLEGLVQSAAGRKVAVCGEIAAKPEFARRLVALGIAELSMAPSSIPAIKAVLRAELCANVPAGPRQT